MEYCQTCGSCQKVAQHHIQPAPLIPLPIIDTPFKRVVMDIVRPLLRSRSLKRYILVYSSRKLLPEEEVYSTVEKECFVIKLGIEAFKVYLLGREFEIHTDHNALV